MKRIYNYKFQEKDERDFKFSPQIHVEDLPKKVDLTEFCPPIYDQLALGSCTSHATAALIAVRRKIESLTEFHPSRLWIYYQARKIEGTIKEDSGATIRDVIKGVGKNGYCSEELLPYNIDKFTKAPSRKCITEAKQHPVKQYESVNQDIISIKSCLAQKYCIAIGVSVYESFESEVVSKTGIVPIPHPTEQFLGGHALALVGYDDETKLFKFRNSWGTSWGDGGYGYFPYEFILNKDLASDFWRIVLV